MADTVSDDYFASAAARLAEESRARVVALPAADVRRRGQRRRLVRTVVTAASTVALATAALAGTYASGVLSAASDDQPAQRPVLSRATGQPPEHFLPLLAVTTTVPGGSGWKVTSTVDSAKTSATSGCGLAKAAVANAGSGTSVIYSGGPVGLTETVATYADEQEARAGFARASEALSRCVTTVRIGDYRNYTTGSADYTSLALVERRVKADADKGRSNAFALQRKGSTVVVLQRQNYVAASATPAPDDPLAAAMSRAMIYAAP